MKKALLLIACLCSLSLLTACDPNKQVKQANARDSAEVLMKVANASRDAGQLNSALNIYRQLSTSYPNQIGPVLGMADTLSDLGRYQEANQYYQMALKIDPNNTIAKRKLGKTYIALKEPEPAIEQFEEILQKNKADYQTINYLAVLLDINRDHQQAQTCYVQALRYAPTDAYVNINYGLSLALTGDYNKAIEYLAVANSANVSENNKANVDLISAAINDMKNAKTKSQQQEISKYISKTLMPTSYPKLSKDEVNNLTKKYCA